MPPTITQPRRPRSQTGAKPANPTPPEARTPAPVLPQQAHHDIQQLTGAVRELAETLKPLKALADHVPALVEMAQAWNAGKTGGRAMGKVAQAAATVAKWISAVGFGFVTVWLLFHARWDDVIKLMKP